MTPGEVVQTLAQLRIEGRLTPADVESARALLPQHLQMEYKEGGGFILTLVEVRP